MGLFSSASRLRSTSRNPERMALTEASPLAGEFGQLKVGAVRRYGGKILVPSGPTRGPIRSPPGASAPHQRFAQSGLLLVPRKRNRRLMSVGGGSTPGT
jgi:hypothetical protein